MGRGVAVRSPRGGIQPLAVSFLFLACLASHACGSCLSYGHSCWGAHGKRSGGLGPRGYISEGLLDSDGPSRGPQYQRPSSSSPTASDPQDALWLISKLMEGTQSEPDDSDGEDEDNSADTKNVKIWRRLLDDNNGGQAHGASEISKATKHRLGSIPVPLTTDLDTGVGIVEFASTPTAENDQVRRGLVLFAEDPDEDEEGEDEDSPTRTTAQDVSRGDNEGRDKESRMTRKAFRRLRILNLLDNLEKKRN